MEKEECFGSIIAYCDKNYENVKFKAQPKAPIEEAVKDSIAWLNIVLICEAAILRFNDIELKINRNSYWKDKVDEYFHCLEIERKHNL